MDFFLHDIFWHIFVNPCLLCPLLILSTRKWQQTASVEIAHHFFQDN